MANARRSYTREFKLAAVKLITEQDYSVAEGGSASGPKGQPSCICGRRRFPDLRRPSVPGARRSSASRRRNRRLRAENNRLQMERDILKKATAFFAAEAR